MRRRISDRSLRRWLRTGRPRGVTRRLEVDETLRSRLEEMTRLDRSETSVLRRLTEPLPLFQERVEAGVRQMDDGKGTSALVADLLTLGVRVGTSLLGHGGDRDVGPGTSRPPVSDEQADGV